MRSRTVTRNKSAAAEVAAAAEKAAQYDAFRAHLGMSVVSDMFEYHKDCGFKDCRAAGRCLAYDKAVGICPIPLDTTRALTFVGSFTTPCGPTAKAASRMTGSLLALHLLREKL